MLHSPGPLLLLDDFDEPSHVDEPAPAPAPEIILPTHPEADLRAARTEAFEQGYLKGRVDATASQNADIAATVRAIATSLEDASQRARETAEASVEAMLRLVVSMIVAGYPSLRTRYGPQEIRRLADLVLPALVREPNVVVHVNPAMSEAVMTELAAFESVSIASAASVPPGDVRITWKDGSAVRDTATAWAAITEILGPLGLLSDNASAESVTNT